MKKRRRNAVRLETLLNDVATPIFLLDARRRIQFFNRGCEHLTGWTAADIIGLVCEFAGDAEDGTRDALAASLCPPPDVFAGRPASVPAYIAHRDGGTAARMLTFLPLSDDEANAVLVLGIAGAIEQAPRPAATSAAQELHAELAALRVSLRQRFGIKSLVARSVPMLRVLAQINVARAADTPALLMGDPGTGKEHVARVIHYQRTPPGNAFVPLDCARLAPLELKQTLRRLIQESAERRSGTLYLANVDALPRDLQEMLVDGLSQKTKDRSPDLRLMGGTSVEPRQLLAREVFLDRFYYLLTPLLIDLPPLRERSEDLPLLAQAFLEQHNRGQQKQVGGFSDEVWKQFREYAWPGNLDELATVVREAWTAAETEAIRVADLPFRFRTGLEGQAVGPRARADVAALDDVLTKTETEHIQLALERSGHNKSKAAKLLGIPRAKLYRRMQALGIADLEAAKNSPPPLSPRERGRG